MNKETIKSKIEPSNTSWHFTPLDTALVDMVNSGSWLYDSYLDIDNLKESLSAVLDNYPVFAGRMTSKDSISTNNAGVYFEVAQQMQYSCKDLAATLFLPDLFKAKFDIKAFKKGNFPVMIVKVTQVSDGTLLNIAVNHVCADGASLYRFVSDWSKIYNGQEISPVVFNQELFPKPQHNLKELMEILTQKKWYKVGFKDLFLMLKDQIQSKKIVASPFFVPYTLLDDLRKKYSIDEHVGKHALLCAYLGDLLFNKDIPENSRCSVVSVVNLRGRAIYPEGFVGNAVANISTENIDVNAEIDKTAEQINSNLRQKLEKQQLTDFFRLYTEAMTLKAPLLPFNLNGTYGKRTCLMVNDFTGFGVYDICFGENSPIMAYPNDLPDKIKMWSGNKQENGFYILLRGNLAKVFKKLYLKKN